MLAERIAEIEGVEAVVLGGPLARDEARPDSDVDLGIYYRPDHPPSLGELRRLAGELNDRHLPDLVTDFGEWGPWINGGGWLRLEGRPVDWLYRDPDLVSQTIEECRAGRAACHYHWTPARLPQPHLRGRGPLLPSPVRSARQAGGVEGPALGVPSAPEAHPGEEIPLGSGLRAPYLPQACGAWRGLLRRRLPVPMRSVPGASAVRTQRALLREREGLRKDRGLLRAVPRRVREDGLRRARRAGTGRRRAPD